MNEWEMCDDVQDTITDKNLGGSKPDMKDRAFLPLDKRDTEYLRSDGEMLSA